MAADKINVEWDSSLLYKRTSDIGTKSVEESGVMSNDQTIEDILSGRPTQVV